MANVQSKVNQIRQAVYGKDVRESIAASIEAMNDECTEAVNGYQDAIDTAEDAVRNATSAAGNANTAAQEARAAATNAQAMVDNYAGMTGPLYEGITLTGNTVETTAAAMPLKSCKLYGPLEAGEYTVNVHGRNYFNINARHGHNADTAAVTTTSGVITAVTNARSAGYWEVTYYNAIQLKANTKYTVSARMIVKDNDGVPRGYVRIGNGTGVLIGSIEGVLEDGAFHKSYTFTTPADGKVKISFRYHNTDKIPLSGGITVTWKDIMLNEGTQALPYEPYHGTTYTTTLTGGALAAGESLDVPGVMSINGYNVITNNANAPMQAAFPASIPSVQEQIKQVETDVDHALSGLIKEYTLTPLNGVTGTIRLYVIGKLGVLVGSVNQATGVAMTIANLPSDALPAITIRTNVTNFAANLEIDTWHAAWATLTAGTPEIKTAGMVSGSQTFNGQLDFNVAFPIK